MITIIIPTLNAEGCLGKLFETIQNQSPKIDEVIIVDSSSGDNTVRSGKRIRRNGHGYTQK